MHRFRYIRGAALVIHVANYTKYLVWNGGMSSRVQQQQQSSAFKSGATRRGSLDRRRHSLRQKKVLARDDSGIFSLSPSPLTPSRGTFPVPPVAEAEPEPGAMSNFDLDVDEGPPGRVHEPVRRAGSQPNFVDGRVMQVNAMLGIRVPVCIAMDINYFVAVCVLITFCVYICQ